MDLAIVLVLGVVGIKADDGDAVGLLSMLLNFFICY
jgi:hypothetical protein